MPRSVQRVLPVSQARRMPAARDAIDARVLQGLGAPEEALRGCIDGWRPAGARGPDLSAKHPRPAAAPARPEGREPARACAPPGVAPLTAEMWDITEETMSAGAVFS